MYPAYPVIGLSRLGRNKRNLPGSSGIITDKSRTFLQSVYGAARTFPLYGDRPGIYTSLGRGSYSGLCGAQPPGVDLRELYGNQTSKWTAQDVVGPWAVAKVP